MRNLTNAEATAFLTYQASVCSGDTVLDLFEMYCDDNAAFTIDYAAFQGR